MHQMPCSERPYRRLCRLISTLSSEDMYTGEHVVVKGLKQSDYNDLRGILLAFDPPSRRWSVRVNASPTTILRIKCQNLEVDESFCCERGVSKENYISFLKKTQQPLVDMQTLLHSSVDFKPRKNIKSEQITFTDSLDVRPAFGQLQRLWFKYGEKYAERIQSLPIEEVIREISALKITYVTDTDVAGSLTSRHIPIPTGLAPDHLCLLPELHTRGPSFKGTPLDQLKLEADTARAWPAFIRMRADPSCLLSDIEHCALLQSAGHLCLDGMLVNEAARTFCVSSPATAALDPRTVPDEATAFFDPPYPSDSFSSKGKFVADSAAAAAAAAAAKSGGRLEVFEVAEAPVYYAALRRNTLLTDLAVRVLVEYRCSVGCPSQKFVSKRPFSHFHLHSGPTCTLLRMTGCLVAHILPAFPPYIVPHAPPSLLSAHRHLRLCASSLPGPNLNKIRLPNCNAFQPAASFA
jgi:hypothetical protein